jgi:hypothetical protein
MGRTEGVLSLLVGILPIMKSAEEIGRLQADGWELVRVKGSHHQFRRPGLPGVRCAKLRSEITNG